MEPEINTENTGQKQGARWKPGQSGNPAGRPRGARHKATLLAEKLLDGQSEALVQKAMEMALSGDTTALRLCLERLCPPRKMRLVNIDLPETKTAEGIADAQSSVVQAVSGGELTPEEGAILSGILDARRKFIETQDHEARIQALEGERNNHAKS